MEKLWSSGKLSARLGCLHSQQQCFVNESIINQTEQQERVFAVARGVLSSPEPLLQLADI